MKTTNSAAGPTTLPTPAEIRWYETRLRELGDGDCSYEKRMVRAYEEAIGRYFKQHRVSRCQS